jgi:hypothetical protein
VEIYEGMGGVPPILVQVVEERKVDRPSDREEVQDYELEEEEVMGGVPLIVV